MPTHSVLAGKSLAGALETVAAAALLQMTPSTGTSALPEIKYLVRRAYTEGRSLRIGQCGERAGVRTIAPIALGGGSRGKVVLAPLLVATDDANPLQVPHHR